MKKLFEKVEVKNLSVLSKSDKKKFNLKLDGILDMKTNYKVLSISTKLKLIRDDSKFLLFEYFGKVVPTISTYNKELFKTVWLDSGALTPLSRGADVMAPGILKYIEKCPVFEKDEIIGVEVEGSGILCIGISMMSYKEMLAVKEGPVIDVLHYKGDKLDTGDIQ